MAGQDGGEENAAKVVLPECYILTLWAGEVLGPVPAVGGEGGGEAGGQGAGGHRRHPGSGGLLSQTLPATIRTTMACRCNMPATWPCWVVPPCHLPQGQDLEVLARLMTRQYLAVQSTGDTNVIYSN